MSQTDQSLELPSLKNYRLSFKPNEPSLLGYFLSEIGKKQTDTFCILAPDLTSAKKIEKAYRLFKKPEEPELAFFPEWETLPYDNFSPRPASTSERFNLLYQLTQSQPMLLLTTLHNALTYIQPPEYLHANAFVLKTGQTIDPLEYTQNITKQGYRNVAEVHEPGTFVKRAGLIDIFPMSSKKPYRIDFFDDTIESIYSFDPKTQRTLKSIDNITLLPAHECPMDEKSQTIFRTQARERLGLAFREDPRYQQVSSGESFGGMTALLPLFFDTKATLLDYLPQGTHFILPTQHKAHIKDFEHYCKGRYVLTQEKQASLAPKDLWINAEALTKKINNLEKTNEDDEKTEHKAFHILFKEQAQALANPPKPKTEDVFLNVINWFKQQQKTKRLLICAGSFGRATILQDWLKLHEHPTQLFEHHLDFLTSKHNLGITVSQMGESIFFPKYALTVLSEHDYAPMKQTNEAAVEDEKHATITDLFDDLSHMAVGDPVVHQKHGVGRFGGLVTLEQHNKPIECVKITYKDNALLYLPIQQMGLLSSYSGKKEEAPLDMLGGKQWAKKTQKAKEAIEDLAADLLKLHAKRAQEPGFTFKLPEKAYVDFCLRFPYTETKDQQRTIDETLADMCSAKRMDRLVCGDVGFGKTEVAMRAAFLAALNQKQVAILVPTTLLAEQHLESFLARFHYLPVRIACLSRLRDKTEQAKTLSALASGHIDIVIGTHQLLQKTVQFKQLGLLIIDEEHRFGVKAKEQMKKIKASVDLLTLTATPIPRTLDMTLSGLKDLSLIASPPKTRQPIKTMVQPFNVDQIVEAIIRECHRGGQVYYVCNDIKKLDERKRMIQEKTNVSVDITHGQMPPAAIEKIMYQFHQQATQVLLTTTIIESGIDVPNANTIIVERADRFGIAQLHQLRGRVGRAHQQAYAYLFTPEWGRCTKEAKMRLEAISQHTELGAGFVLSTADLEIRGAGMLLGEKQAGHVQHIGYHLYLEWLKEAIKTLREGHGDGIKKAVSHVTIQTKIPALIPESYMPDVHQRMALYQKISRSTAEDELDNLKINWMDRFGDMPEQLNHLFKLAYIALKANEMGVECIQCNTSNVVFSFDEHHENLDQKKLIASIMDPTSQLALLGKDKIKMHTTNDPTTQLDALNAFLASYRKIN